jgi:hypothetical protein
VTVVTGRTVFSCGDVLSGINLIFLAAFAWIRA